MQIMRIAALCFLALILVVPSAAAQSDDFVLKAVCIGGYANMATEVAATADGTVSRQQYSHSAGAGKGWKVVGHNPDVVARWLKSVDATKTSPARAPTTANRDPCNVGGPRPCHIVRRKGNAEHYVCAANAVAEEMMEFNERTGKPRATGAFEVPDRWRQAYLKADVDALVKLFAPDALFIGTDSKEVITGSTGIRTYFETLFASQRPRDDGYQFNNIALSEDVAVVAGNTILTDRSERARITFVIARRGTEWLIVHFHSSTMPK